MSAPSISPRRRYLKFCDFLSAVVLFLCGQVAAGEPTNLVFRANLAVLQLQMTNETKRATARAALNQLRTIPVMR